MLLQIYLYLWILTVSMIQFESLPDFWFWVMQAPVQVLVEFE